MKCLLILGAVFGFALAAKIEYSQWNTVFSLKKESYENGIVRIVGGQVASPHQFPYQVGLYVQYKLNSAFCGGSLVSNNYVLTAAHCAEGATSMSVILGAHNISDSSESTRQTQTSTTFVVHPKWDSSSFANDLALVKLSTPAAINDYVQIVKLAFGNDSYATSEGVITGWGKTTDAQTSVTDILRYATNTIMSNTECKQVDSNYNGIILDTNLCLSGDGNVSICKGDSGGPLISGSTQVGISSFTSKSCESGKPSVYSRLSEYTQWIKDNSDVTL